MNKEIKEFRDVIEDFRNQIPYWHKKAAPFDCWEAFDEYNGCIELFLIDKLKEQRQEIITEIKGVRNIESETREYKAVERFRKTLLTS